MSHTVYLLNGASLKLLDTRECNIDGIDTFADAERECRILCEELYFNPCFLQSNHLYELVDWIQEARKAASGIVINPGAFTHTSTALLDALHDFAALAGALNAFDGPVIEVHVSNVHRSGRIRRHSYVPLRADGVIAGCGTEGYLLALRRLRTLIDQAVLNKAFSNEDRDNDRRTYKTYSALWLPYRSVQSAVDL
jgi:3-dehydroquinate dehydratase II